jgi:hypothetical protein
VNVDPARSPPPGVTLVRTKKVVTGLRVDPDGLSMRTDSKRGWRPIARPVAVKVKVIRSRVLLTLEDGSKLTLRPYLPSEKIIPDCGKKDVSWNWTTSGNDDIVGLILMVAMAIPAIYILVRALTGVSPRCHAAASLVAQIQPVLVVRKP